MAAGYPEAATGHTAPSSIGAMPDPSDVQRAWESVIRQLKDLASPITDHADLASLLAVPMQRQAELFDELLQRQARLEEQIVGRALAPVTMALDLTDQSVATMRAQATAFAAAASSFQQASELLELQASLLERTTQTLRDPLSALRSAGGRLTGGGERPPSD
jgi:signal transduction histidine kinase